MPDAAVGGGQEGVDDAVDDVVEGGVLVNKLLARDIEEIVGAVPPTDVVGSELGGLRATSVPAEGLGQGEVQVVDVGGAGVGAAELIEHVAVEVAVKDSPTTIPAQR